MAEPCRNGKYLVLHFRNGELTSTKITRTWRGAMMSKWNHERGYGFGPRADSLTRILPIDAILQMAGLEKPDTDLSEEDFILLRRMGIDL